MLIEEGSADQTKLENSRQPEEGFEFTNVSLADPKVFPNFKDAKIQQCLFKWGMKDTLEVAKFRFNKSFHLVAAEEFLKDLFNSK